MRTEIGKAKGLLAVLDSLASMDTENLTESELVEFGHILWNLIARANDLMNPVKDRLRKEALATLGGSPGTAYFEGITEGRATVKVPHPRIKLPARTDVGWLRERLGDETFDRLFDTRLSATPSPHLEDRLADLDPETQTFVASAIDVIEDTPRVSFK